MKYRAGTLGLLLLWMTSAAQAVGVVVIPMSGGDLQPLKNIISVAKANGDFDNPVDAINSIPTSGSGMPSASNPYLIVIAPGVYTLDTPLNMREYVDVAGSGENVTRLTGAIGADLGNFTALVNISSNNAALTHLSVENTGNSSVRSLGIHIGADLNSTVRLENLKVFASGGTTYNHGIFVNLRSAPILVQVEASAIGGEYSYGIMNSNSKSIMNLVTASASGAKNNFGIHNSADSSVMTQVSSTATGGTFSYGVYNDFTSHAIMNLVTASASGGAKANYGVYNHDSSFPTMTEVTATASGGTSYGVYIDSSPSIIRRSTLKGSTFGLKTIKEGASSTGATVSQTTIVNGVSGPNLTCVASDNGNGKALTALCLTPL